MTWILEQRLSAYELWLARLPLADNTRRVYLLQVRQYGIYLVTRGSLSDDPLYQLYDHDQTVRDYETYLKAERKVKSSSINVALAAIDHFYLFLGIDHPQIKREEVPQQSPQLLKPEEQHIFLRVVEHISSARDQAIAYLLFYTGLLLSECAALNVDNLNFAAQGSSVSVCSSEGCVYREVPLNADACKALKIWLEDRTRRFPHLSEQALFLNLKGKRLSTRAIDLVVRQLGVDANLKLSARVLRHTCLANLVQQGKDLRVIAEVAGHKRLETTRHYRLPSAEG